MHRLRQPAMTLLSGTLIALAINFSLAQVNGPEPANTLDRFEIHTDKAAKEVRITLVSPTDQRGDSPIRVEPEKKGSQLNLLLPDTRLSQTLIDQGLPVVIDNQNRLIGRAVPAGGGKQSKIIIPNLPSDDYKITVLQKSPSQGARIISQVSPTGVLALADDRSAYAVTQPETAITTADDSPAASTSQAATQALVKAPIQSRPLVQARRPQRLETAQASEAPLRNVLQPAFQSSYLPEQTTLAMQSSPEAIDLRLIKVIPASDDVKPASGSAKPKPRQAVGALQSEFESLVQRFEAPSQDDSAHGSDSPALRPARRPPTVVSQGAVTYVPDLSSLSGRAEGEKRKVIWNPYVVSNKPKGQEAEQSQSFKPQPAEFRPAVSEPVATVAMAESSPNQPYTVPPAPQQPDPLWYLHSLPAGDQASQNLALDAPPPDLTQPLPIETGANPTLSQVPGSVNTVQIDTGFFKSLRQGLNNLPLWLYVTVGLFFGGIGLFALVGAVLLIRQLWHQLTLQPALNTATSGPPVGLPSQAGPQHSAQKAYATPPIPQMRVPMETAWEADPAFLDPRSTQFEDVSTIQGSRYLKGSPNSVRQAVQHAVLLKFPASRAGRKASARSRAI